MDILKGRFFVSENWDLVGEVVRVSYRFVGHNLLPWVAVRRLMGLESERNFHGPEPAALTLLVQQKIQPAPEDRLRIRIVAFSLTLAHKALI
jgi:hypothetical protein